MVSIKVHHKIIYAAAGVFVVVTGLIFVGKYTESNPMSQVVDVRTQPVTTKDLTSYAEIGGGPHLLRLAELQPETLPFLETPFAYSIDDFELKPSVYFDLIDPISVVTAFYSGKNRILHSPDLDELNQADAAYYQTATLKKLDWVLRELRTRESYLTGKQEQYPGFDFDLLLLLLSPAYESFNAAITAYNRNDFRAADEHAFVAGYLAQRHSELLDLDDVFQTEKATLDMNLYWLKALHTENNQVVGNHIQEVESALRENELRSARASLDEALRVSDRYKQAAWLAKISPDTEPGLWSALHWLLVDNTILDAYNFDIFGDSTQFGSQRELPKAFAEEYGCYVIVANNVYETYKLTRYSALFPAMEQLQNRCGEDVTELIAQQPVTSGSLNTARFKWALTQFHIGVIKK